MLSLHAVQAAEGDCLILEYGTGKFVLIDGGAEGTYENHLGRVLNALSIRRLELAILSHVDDDHVSGLIKLFSDIELKKRTLEIGGFWHNAFSKTMGTRIEQQVVEILDEAPARSFKQGSDLAGHAERLGIALNAGFAGGLVSVESAQEPFPSSDLQLRVVAPDHGALEALRDLWEKWIEKNRNAVRGGEKPDRSPTNLSSIVVLARAAGRSVLLTGDATHAEILSGLKTAGELRDDHLHVDLLKVPHHGSNRNVTSEFFEQVTADTYLISADGKHGNPDRRTLHWLVDAARKQKRRFSLKVTNAPAQLLAFVRDEPPGDIYSLETMSKSNHCLTVPLAEAR
jgi:beta-lactamase superfamily II metal-dependent hydrolase